MGLPTTIRIVGKWNYLVKEYEIIIETFNITYSIEEVFSFPENEVDLTSENSAIGCLNAQSSDDD